MKPLSVTLDIFFQPVGCVLILFMVPIAVQNMVSLLRSYLFSFAFVSVALEEWWQKNITSIYVGKYIVLFKELVVYCVVFKPFWVYFCVWRESLSTHWLVAVQVFKYRYLKGYLVFNVCSCFLSQRLIDCRCVGLLLGSLTCAGKIEGRKRRERQKMRWLDASLTQWAWVWINSGEIVKDREAWRAAVCGVIKSQTWHTTEEQQLTCAFDPCDCFVLVPWSLDYCSLVVLSEFWAAFFFLHRIALVVLGLL